jgi:hypothetical protein
VPLKHEINGDGVLGAKCGYVANLISEALMCLRLLPTN